MHHFEKEEAFNMEEIFEFLDNNFKREKLNVSDQIFIHDKHKMKTPFLHVDKYLKEGENKLLGNFLKKIRNKEVDVTKNAKICSNFYPESKIQIVENQFEKYLP